MRERHYFFARRMRYQAWQLLSYVAGQAPGEGQALAASNRLLLSASASCVRATVRVTMWLGEGRRHLSIFGSAWPSCIVWVHARPDKKQVPVAKWGHAFTAISSIHISLTWQTCKRALAPG